MRMWHKSLIEVLPREQLIAQWRELSSIAGNISIKGTPNHILVNPVIDYPLSHFITYAAAVRAEMTRRGYRTMDKVWDKICSICSDYEIIPLNEIYVEWMDKDYLCICSYNLYEKYLRGGIKKEDWDKIEKTVREKLNNEW